MVCRCQLNLVVYLAPYISISRACALFVFSSFQVCAQRERERNTHRIAVGLVTHHKVWESNLFRSLVAFLFVDLFHRGNFSRRLGWNSMTYSDISRGVIFFFRQVSTWNAHFHCCVAWLATAHFNDDHHFISDDVLRSESIHLKEVSVLFIIILKFIYQ